MSPPHCICLMGPTACGKSDLAIRLAQKLADYRPVEIISVDSAMVYRGLDIGTAKPDIVERAGIPHPVSYTHLTLPTICSV